MLGLEPRGEELLLAYFLLTSGEPVLDVLTEFAFVRYTPFSRASRYAGVRSDTSYLPGVPR